MPEEFKRPRSQDDTPDIASSKRQKQDNNKPSHKKDEFERIQDRNEAAKRRQQNDEERTKRLEERSLAREGQGPSRSMARKSGEF